MTKNRRKMAIFVLHDDFRCIPETWDFSSGMVAVLFFSTSVFGRGR